MFPTPHLVGARDHEEQKANLQSTTPAPPRPPPSLLGAQTGGGGHQAGGWGAVLKGR
jgi:hypothetical protein